MTQPPPGPPQGPPWGHYPPPGSQPPKGRGLHVFSGVMIGGFATFVLPFMALGLADAMGVGLGALLVALVIVPITAVALMFNDATRPWGVGLLIGWAIVLIVAGGACVAILSSLS